MTRGRLFRWFVGSALACASVAPTATTRAAALSVTPVGSFALPANDTGAAELSGITYAGGTQFYSVADSGAGLFPLTVNLNTTTGAIASAALSSKIQLAGSDLEGVAYNPTNNTLLVSDETGPAVRIHNLTTGAQLGSVALPAVYQNIRANFSLESLSRESGTGNLWTSNEEALGVDGPLSTTSAGSVVRMQKFAPDGTPAGQVAYVTERITTASGFAWLDRSGVSDLVALPDGRLLVLEREFGGQGFRNRLYLVDPTTGTDVGAEASLAGATFTPVGKSLLWTSDFSTSNYEGITLGPDLVGGDHSLILIEDNNGLSASQNLYALRLTGAIPEPASATLLGLGAVLLCARRRARSHRGVTG